MPVELRYSAIQSGGIAMNCATTQFRVEIIESNCAVAQFSSKPFQINCAVAQFVSHSALMHCAVAQFKMKVEVVTPVIWRIEQFKGAWLPHSEGCPGRLFANLLRLRRSEENMDALQVY